jgi:hypothetical protein
MITVAADVRRLILSGIKVVRALSLRLLPITRPRREVWFRGILSLLAGVAALLGGCASRGTGDSAEPRGYMRVAQPDKDTVALQIAWRKFSPKRGRGPTIWLAGASHLGESNYFARLQRLLDVQSLVLFEGVGARSKKMRFNPDEETSIQHTMASALGLVFQLSAIDYDRPHYTNSDLTIPQLQALLSGGAGGGSGPDTKAGQEFQQLLQVMDGSSLLGTLMHVGLKFIGSSPKLQAMTKVLLVETLGRLEGDMSQMKGVPPEIQRLLAVIIQERNKVVLEDLKARLRAASPPNSIAVFYGAGHMADLEKRLRGSLGYRPRGEMWLTAMSVNTRQAGLSSEELAAMRSLIQWQMDALKP